MRNVLESGYVKVVRWRASQLTYRCEILHTLLLEQFQTEFVTVQFEFQIDSLPTKLNIKVTQNK